jgi:hypothetical protein
VGGIFFKIQFKINFSLKLPFFYFNFIYCKDI